MKKHQVTAMEVFYAVLVVLSLCYGCADWSKQADDRMRAHSGEESSKPITVEVRRGGITYFQAGCLIVISLAILYSLCRLRLEFHQFVQRVEPSAPPPLE